MTKTERTCVSNIHIAKQDVMQGKFNKVILTRHGKDAMMLSSIKLVNENQNYIDYLEAKVTQLEEQVSDLLCGRII